MRYSTYNWPHRGRRGWIIGPFFGVVLSIDWDSDRVLTITLGMK